MRVLAVVLLTLSQFTAFPFIAMVAANTARHADDGIHETRVNKQVELTKGTVIYKTMEM